MRGCCDTVDVHVRCTVYVHICTHVHVVQLSPSAQSVGDVIVACEKITKQEYMYNKPQRNVCSRNMKIR